MSWSSFKAEMAVAMGSYGSMINFATKLTNAYDNAVKSGKTIITGIPLQTGQKEAMKSLLITELTIQQLSNSKTLLETCGPAIQAYWTGATLMPMPPGLPCVGTITNISVLVAPVLNPGVWTPIPSLPVPNLNMWLDEFIICAKIHMLTVSGLHNCISLYPGVPPIPGPCTIPWSGYNVS